MVQLWFARQRQADLEGLESGRPAGGVIPSGVQFPLLGNHQSCGPMALVLLHFLFGS